MLFRVPTVLDFERFDYAMMRTSVLRALLAATAATASLALSGCGGDSAGSGTHHGGGSATANASAAAAGFNDADIAFAQHMIEHHRQAVEMADLAGGRAADARVKELAGKIKAAQQPEIDTMSGWLTAWGMPASAPAMDHGSMPGMMSDADMTTLAGAKGAAFDKQFLTMMISHHEGAIEMAGQEAAQGSSAEAKALAARIVTDQRAEIATMRSLLGGL